MKFDKVKMDKDTLLAIAGAICVLTLLGGCREEEPTVEQDLTPYVLVLPDHVPPPILPNDNALTETKVHLGKMLFYETELSGDGTMSCATCHMQASAFTDTAQFSVGINGLEGHRNAMAVFNMAWNTNGFLWDGGPQLLRHQSLLPIQDGLEMDETLDDVIAKLSANQVYIDAFIRAFGDELITPQRMSLAMEQFMLSITSFSSKYDRYLAGQTELTESELRGLELFTTEYNEFFPEYSGADCQHCHGGINFSNSQFMNNGLDAEGTHEDLGRFVVTGNAEDVGRFKVTSLRNIALTAPYMHDGRFNTLEEVLDHYDHGLQESSTLDPALAATMSTGLMLTDQDKADLIAFMNTLTDDGLTTETAFASPFE